jgi:hypothetical protein
MKGYLRKTGDVYICLRQGGRCQREQIGRLILYAFVGEPPPGTECCHYDGNAQNNRLENLRWDTHRSNHEDNVRLKRVSQGERHYNSKLTKEDVQQIRLLYQHPRAFTLQEIADRFGVSRNYVKKVGTCQKWKHLT